MLAVVVEDLELVVALEVVFEMALAVVGFELEALVEGFVVEVFGTFGALEALVEEFEEFEMESLEKFVPEPEIVIVPVLEPEPGLGLVDSGNLLFVVAVVHLDCSLYWIGYNCCNFDFGSYCYGIVDAMSNYF